MNDLYGATAVLTLLWIVLYFSSPSRRFRSRPMRYVKGRVDFVKRVNDGEVFYYRERIGFPIESEMFNFQQAVNFRRDVGSHVHVFYPEGFPEYAKEGNFTASSFQVFSVIVALLWLLSLIDAFSQWINFRVQNI